MPDPKTAQPDNDLTRVFISYCHEETPFQKAVRELADKLNKEGLDCELDQYNSTLTEGWPRWMDRMIREADYVLVVCTERYQKRARGNEEPGKGLGGRWEASLAYQEIYQNDSKNGKYIPILLRAEDSEFIPDPLRPYTHYRIYTDQGYQDLYRALTEQPLYVKPQPGQRVKLQTGINLSKQADGNKSLRDLDEAVPEVIKRSEMPSASAANIYGQLPERKVAADVLEQARATLASLPIDTIPPPSTSLPKGSRMPFLSNPNFVGREEELLSLAKTLKQGSTSAITAATGIGGVGKSQLAIEFAYRYGTFFEGGVFWLGFAEPANVPVEIANCGNEKFLNLQSYLADLPLNEQAKQVAAYFESPLPKLLIFDNCENYELLKQWQPKKGGSCVLVTSRKDDWTYDSDADNVTQVSLTTLSRPESLKLLHNYRTDLSTDDSALNSIAEELGDLPLALFLAANFLKRYSASTLGQPASYLAQLQDQDLLSHPSLQGKGSTTSPTKHDLNVAKTFALSYDQLNTNDSTDQVAVQLLARAAFFAPSEAIPRDLLIATLNPDHAGKETEAVQDLEAALQTEDALQRLTSLGLLEQEESGDLKIHRLIAAFAQTMTPSSEAQDAVKRTLYLQAKTLNDEGYPAPLQVWQSHLRFVTEFALGNKDEQAADLAYALGFHLKVIANYDESYSYIEQSLAIRKRVLGLEHAETALCLNDIGLLLQTQGDYEKAKSYHEQALEIREQVLGPRHSDTATSLNNLGTVLHAQGDYEGAKSYYERSLKISEEVLGPKHPDTATSLNNLGSLLKAQGDYEGAKPHFDRALAILEEVLGTNHPITKIAQENRKALIKERKRNKHKFRPNR